MAFVYRENKLKKIRPNTALGPGEYLSITKEKKIKNNITAPFESNEKKFKSFYGGLNAIRNATPGPGKYYFDELKIKTKKLENLSNIKRSNLDDFNQNKSESEKNICIEKEKLGFDIKGKRFKDEINKNPGPGEYFRDNKIKKYNDTKQRARSALYLMGNSVPKDNVFVPSIPYKDNGFEIGENNSLIKLESDNDIWKKNQDKLGPGSYDIDNPKEWLRGGTSWSKMKVERDTNLKNYQNLKDITRPETALNLNINYVSEHSTDFKEKKSKTKKRLKTAKYIPVYYQMLKDSIGHGGNLKSLTNKKNNEFPIPDYYIDIVKDSGFYKDTIPYPEYKQFFLSNNQRFIELKKNEFLGPATYFENNNYYKSSFSSEKILKKKDKNKIAKTPFNTREKRFKKVNNDAINEEFPGPGTYNPKIMKAIESNKFNNNTNTFNFRSKRFGTAGSDFKWKNSIPGPGSYINPYTATGTSNTLLINGLYLNIRKGKALLKPKSKETIPLKKPDNMVPGVGSFNPGLISSIAYNNRKKTKLSNDKVNVAFNTAIKKEKNKVYKSNIGPGYYYHPKQFKEKQINPPFLQSTSKFKKDKNIFGIGPGYYESRSYFDWNKKSFNSLFN